MRRPGLLALAVLALSACSTGGSPADDPVSGPAPEGSPSSSDQPPAGAASASAPAPSSAPPSQAEPTSVTPATGALRIVVELGDGTEVSGELDDSPTARSLLEQLPLTLALSDFGGQEKIATLHAPLSLDGAPARSDAPALTIGYYTPTQSLVLYYEDVGTFGGIVPLGRLDDVAPLVARTEDFTATLRAGG